MEKRQTQLSEYTQISNSLVRDIAPRVEDRISVEIGDTKQAEFFPQAKISRWDNETNFSIRRDNGARSFVERDGKIVAEGAQENVVIYELAPDEQNEDGGLEIEIELPRQPKTNVFEFTLQTKGLNFYYQAPLTAEEIEQGASRPENIEGSYAVYHATKRDNRVGGKHYKTGKAFHIYRPKAIDADGNEVWCELNITEQAGVLTVTVPEKWLASASYPVRVDPTFGYTSVGGSNSGTSADFLSGNDHTAPANGTVTSIHQHLKVFSAGTTLEIKGVLVLTSSLNILTNGVGNPSSTIGDTAVWAVSSFSTPPNISASTKYFISAVANNASRISIDSGTNAFRDTSNSYVTPTNPTDRGALGSATYSIYATYTTNSAPTVTTQAVTAITETTATGNGNVTDDGGATITERGVCWNTTGTPTTANSKATSAGTTGAFTASMTGLTASTTYYVRAYAINSEGTSYGSEVSFTTNAANPDPLTANQGSYTLTGQATALQFVRKITPTQGTYTTTGHAVTLTINRKITPTQGTYTLTGYQAGISQNSQLVASQATYSLSGQAVTLTVNRLSSGTFKTATVNAASVAATVTDFPVYVDLARVGMTTLAQAQSSRWYTDSAKINEIPREIVSAGEGHGKYPSLTATSQLYIDYDGIRADYAVGDTYGRNAVWSDYAGVYHMNEDPSGSAPQMIDSTGNSNGTSAGSMTSGDLISGKFGKALDFDGSNDYINLNDGGALLPDSGDYSMTMWLNFGSVANSIFLGNLKQTGNTGIQLFMFATTDKIIAYFFGSGVDSRENSTALTTGTWYHYGVTWDATTETISPYLNGAQELGTQYDNNTVGAITNTQDMFVGARNLDGSPGSYGNVDFGELRFKKAKDSANWITTEYNNQSDESGFWGTWSDVGGATNETIEPAQGTYFLTGNSVGLTVNRTLSATQGSYTLTGQNTGLLRGRTTSLEGTEYAQTGFSVGLRISRHLAINQGAYSVTGHDTQFSRDYRLPATTGTYTLTGYQAGLSTEAQMVASQGSYTLSGNTVGLSVTRKLTTDQGTYTLSGQTIDTARGYSIQPTTGTYTLTGQATNLLTTYTLPAEAGTYTFTGNDTGLSRRYSLAPTTGDYTLTGQVVFLGNQPLVLLAQGQYDLNGQEVRLVKYAGACPPTFRAKGRPFTDRASAFTAKTSPFSDKCGG